MSFKPTSLIAFAVALLLVAMSCQPVEAVSLPIWCICKNNTVTQSMCKEMGGNWDGGSCGLDKQSSYDKFEKFCYNITGRRPPHCWN
ncbi:hypothetical protein EC968_004072 [Mortierella alpina]|nr:hypothetical protein EC968_004072 [Mortierella alpina]